MNLRPRTCYLIGTPENPQSKLCNDDQHPRSVAPMTFGPFPASELPLAQSVHASHKRVPLRPIVSAIHAIK